MGLLKEWIEKRLERKGEENKKYWKAHEFSKGIATQELKAAQDKMLCKPCALTGMKFCRRECIHFDSGNIIDFSSPYETYPIHKVVKPRCKLWRD